MQETPRVPGFAARTQTYLATAAARARRWFDVDGQWIGDSPPVATRERFWLCCALYAMGEEAFADAIIRRGETPNYHGVYFDIFDTNIAAALYLRHRGQMAGDVRDKLARLVRDGFSFRPGNRQPDYQFHGYNDNMPAKATLGLILGGELLDCPAAVAYGLWNLRQLRALLTRRGINSEFNSPTYTPLTIHAMGEIVAHAQSAEARALAMQLETRLWIDLAARFHPETGVLAGPYARAYTIDTLAHCSCAASLLWFLLGDRARPSPMLFFDPPAGLVQHHAGDNPFNIIQMCWFASGTYHVPEAAWALFAEKSYPFHATATCEIGDSGVDFPARPSRIETVQHADFTLGTASTPFCGGEQTMSYFVTYRRQAPVTSFRDVGTVFTKLVLDDEVPGTIRPGSPDPINGEADHLHSFANTLTLQAETTALVLTHPHLALGEAAAGVTGKSPARSLHALSELVIFPAHFGGAEEILVGGEPRATWDGPFEHGQWIACRRGRLLIAIRPLAYTRALGPVRLTLERCHHYEVIRATFYRGERRTFTREELRHVFGGFVAEHASVDEYPSLAAFAAELAEAGFTDYFWTTRRTRYRRPAGRARPALELETSWSPGSCQPRFATINGTPPPTPIVAIDGIAADMLPCIDEPFTPVPPFFPWEDFRVAWGEWPYAIGDREV